MAGLRDLLVRPGCLILPGVFDGISARVAASVGAPAAYMTGYGAVASALGMPDAGLASYAEMLDRVRCVAGALGPDIPFLADGDTGYGGLLNAERTVRGYAAAGAAGIQLEDQEFPKKCGHTQGRRVIPVADAVAKIRVAVQARPSEDFLIVARTDARTGLGLEAAIDRAARFADAGADVLFVESPESEAEMETIGRRLAGTHLLANMVEGGRTPVLSAARLAELGFSVAIFPATGFLAVAHALRAQYAHLLSTGASAGAPAPMIRFDEMNTLMGFERVWAFDAAWADAAE